MYDRLIRLVLSLALISAAGLGCFNQTLDTEYGRRRGFPGRESVNGTAVLSHFVEQEGYRVSSWNRISPKLNRADVIIWVPDSFCPPTQAQRDFIENWLQEGDGRTLVYVGRDYDAEPVYWAEVAAGLPPSDAKELQSRERDSRLHHALIREDMPENMYCEWFVTRGKRPCLSVDTLEGPWSRAVDAAKVAIELHGRLEFPDESDVPQEEQYNPSHYEELLTSRGDLIVGRFQKSHWPKSQVIVICNGSFLLNMPLVNPEHRKLAYRLVGEISHDRVAASDRRVVFLETNDSGPDVHDEDPQILARTGFEAFTAWPLGFILLHLFVLGLVFCLSRFPIFGPPRSPESETASDFGIHVAALGDLIKRTGDSGYAKAQIMQYQQITKREGAS